MTHQTNIIEEIEASAFHVHKHCHICGFTLSERANAGAWSWPRVQHHNWWKLHSTNSTVNAVQALATFTPTGLIEVPSVALFRRKIGISIGKVRPSLLARASRLQ